jgi:solute carrier family 45 protein 1/2/4
MSLIALAWVSNIMHALAAIVNIHSDEGVKTMIQIGIIVCITLLNLSIQPLQSGLRALIVDICPSEQQSVASAWAGCFSGFSNILGYILGSLPLGFVSHDNEVWRFRFLSLVSVVALGATVLLTAYFIHEEDPREFAYAPREGMLLIRVLRAVKNSWSSMPAQSQHVCLVQFFAWMGWFGFLFYSTSYVGRLYMIESQRRGVEHFYQGDAGIRLGTFANLLAAMTALATMVIAPYVASTYSVGRLSEKPIPQTRFGWWRQTHIIWAMSHLLYAFCTFGTLFISSTNTAVFIIALTGISWGVTQWAPFALLGEEIAINQAEQDSIAAEREGLQWMSSQSGAMMGVHNAAISIPQILAAVASSFIFVIFEGSRSDGDNGIVWVLRLSGVAALIAAYFAWRLK